MIDPRAHARPLGSRSGEGKRGAKQNGNAGVLKKHRWEIEMLENETLFNKWAHNGFPFFCTAPPSLHFCSTFFFSHSSSSFELKLFLLGRGSLPGEWAPASVKLKGARRVETLLWRWRVVTFIPPPPFCSKSRWPTTEPLSSTAGRFCEGGPGRDATCPRPGHGDPKPSWGAGGWGAFEEKTPAPLGHVLWWVQGGGGQLIRPSAVMGGQGGSWHASRRGFVAQIWGWAID